MTDFQTLAKHLRQFITPDLSMNEILIQYYRAETGATTFKSYKKWKEEGKQVQKGQKGYALFSRPIGVIKQEQGKQVNEDEMRYFGTCYVFNENQVK